jgi:hypothetical protein
VTEIITVFTKVGGPLTKRISLDANGTLKGDGSACLMTRGTAQRVQIGGVSDLAALIEQLEPSQAIALGALRPDLPDAVQVVTKLKLNGHSDTIARTGSNIVFQPAQPAFALLDHDTKGMPDEVAAEMHRRGGFWPTLLTVLPELKLRHTLSVAQQARDCSAAIQANGWRDQMACTSTPRCRTVLTLSAS